MSGEEHPETVDLDPVPAEIVSDKRDTLGKRLGLAALAILILFFAINGYIQSAKNGRLLRTANQDRHALVKSVSKLTASNKRQSDLVKQLQDAVRAQNKLLRQVGSDTVLVPGETNIFVQEGDNSRETPRSRKTPKNDPPNKRNPNSPDNPDPPPPPGGPLDTICELTGICA